MIRPSARLVLALTVLSLPSCGWFRKDKPQPKEPPKPKLVGKIATVSPDHKFVLIQSYGPWEVPSGNILTTRGDEARAANLRYTGEQLGQFAAADIQAGTPAAGDPVYTQPVLPPEKPAEKPPGTPETPPPGPTLTPSPPPATVPPSTKPAPDPGKSHNFKKLSPR